MIYDTKLLPVTVGIGPWQGLVSQNNKGGGAFLRGVIISASVMSTIRLTIAFLPLQRYWQGALSIGSLK